MQEIWRHLDPSNDTKCRKRHHLVTLPAQRRCALATEFWKCTWTGYLCCLLPIYPFHCRILLLNCVGWQLLATLSALLHKILNWLMVRLRLPNSDWRGGNSQQDTKTFRTCYRTLKKVPWRESVLTFNQFSRHVAEFCCWICVLV